MRRLPHRGPLEGPVPKPLLGPLLVGLLLLPLLAACGDGTRLSPGDTVPARDEAQFEDGAPSTLTLPTGTLDIFLGEPLATLPPGRTDEADTLQAPDGTLFVPITWRYDGAGFGADAPYLGDDTAPRFDLLADDTAYRIPAPPDRVDAGESFYVLVEGTGQRLRLRAELAGVAQSVDLRTGERDAGAAAGLYDERPAVAPSRSCTDDTTFRPTGSTRVPSFSCTLIGPVSLPYAAGRWAPDGGRWVGVTLRTTLNRYDVALPAAGVVRTFAGRSATVQLRLEDQEPVLLSIDRGESPCPETNGPRCITVVHAVFPALPAGVTAPRLRGTVAYDLLDVTGGVADPDAQGGTLKARIATPLR